MGLRGAPPLTDPSSEAGLWVSSAPGTVGRRSLPALTDWLWETSGLGGQVKATGVHFSFQGKATPARAHTRSYSRDRGR